MFRPRYQLSLIKGAIWVCILIFLLFAVWVCSLLVLIVNYFADSIECLGELQWQLKIVDDGVAIDVESGVRLRNSSLLFNFIILIFCIYIYMSIYFNIFIFIDSEANYQIEENGKKKKKVWSFSFSFLACRVANKSQSIKKRVTGLCEFIIVIDVEELKNYGNQQSILPVSRFYVYMYIYKHLHILYCCKSVVYEIYGDILNARD